MREEQELGRVGPLALAAVALPQELFELVLELLDEVVLLAQGREQLADEPVSGVEVVGEWLGRGRHTPYYVDGCSCIGAITSRF